MDIATDGSLLVSLLNKNLPSELHVILLLKFENDIWHSDNMLKWLKTEVKAQEKSMSIGTSSGLEKK